VETVPYDLLFVLGHHEVFVRQDLDKAKDYWRDISDKQYLRMALEDLAYGLWNEGRKAQLQGDKKKAK